MVSIATSSSSPQLRLADPDRRRSETMAFTRISVVSGNLIRWMLAAAGALHQRLGHLPSAPGVRSPGHSPGMDTGINIEIAVGVLHS